MKLHPDDPYLSLDCSNKETLLHYITRSEFDNYFSYKDVDKITHHALLYTKILCETPSGVISLLKPSMTAIYMGFSDVCMVKTGTVLDFIVQEEGESERDIETSAVCILRDIDNRK